VVVRRYFFCWNNSVPLDVILIIYFAWSGMNLMPVHPSQSDEARSGQKEFIAYNVWTGSPTEAFGDDN
jgi:hypothetical protein